MNTNSDLYKLIKDKNEELAVTVVEKLIFPAPKDSQKRRPPYFDKSVRDVKFHLDYLAEAIAVDDPWLFAEYTDNARRLLSSIGFNETVLLRVLDVMGDVLTEAFDDKYKSVIFSFLKTARDFLDLPHEKPSSFISPANPHHTLVRDYLDYLLNGRKRLAATLIHDAVDRGIDIRDIYTHVLQFALCQVGQLWEQNIISVAEEHYCTSATQSIMGELTPRFRCDELKDLTVVATSVTGDLHDVGIRMVSDFYDMDGWNVYFLGANTPMDSIVKVVKDQAADLLAVSVTIARFISNATELIFNLRESEDFDGLKIIVGGYPFNVSDKLYKSVGADGSAPDAERALVLGNGLTGQVSGKV